MLDPAGAQIKATSVCVLGRHIIAGKDGLLEMTETEAVVLGRSYHVVGQNGAELSPEAQLQAQRQADDFARRQREANEKRIADDQAGATAQLEEAKKKSLEPLTAEEVLAAGYTADDVEAILNRENPIRERTKALIGEGMTHEAARVQAENEAEEAQAEEVKLPTESQLGKMNKATLQAQAQTEGILVAPEATNSQIVAAILAARPKE
jgi:hypothetical protein